MTFFDEAKPYDVGEFSHSCYVQAEKAWKASFSHPFVLALETGKLDQKLFRFYQMQDAKYLEAFADAAMLIAMRCHEPEDKLWFLEAAKIALVGEQELHMEYGKSLGYGPEDIAKLKETPSNLAYQNHMIRTAQTGHLLEAVAALAPCPWLYIDLGQYFLKKMGQIDPSHPYAAWLEMYSQPAFLDFMEGLVSRLERFAKDADLATKERARQAFELSARYEYMFWNQAWTEETWPAAL